MYSKIFKTNATKKPLANIFRYASTEIIDFNTPVIYKGCEYGTSALPNEFVNLSVLNWVNVVVSKNRYEIKPTIDKPNNILKNIVSSIFSTV